MKKIIGKETEVHLTEKEILNGLLFDYDEDYIYLQRLQSVITIPKNNIRYYVSSAADISVHAQTINAENILKVKIDGNLAANIIVPSDLDLSSCSNEVVELAYSNESVRSLLSGKVQQGIEYDIGDMNIITVPIKKLESNNNFSIGHLNNISNPSDMAFRIGGKK